MQQQIQQQNSNVQRIVEMLQQQQTVVGDSDERPATQRTVTFDRDVTTESHT